MKYDFELAKVMHEISGSKRVGLQFPEGLKEYAMDIASKIRSSTDADVFILCDPTYGGCDLNDRVSAELELDTLVHFGHTRFEPK